MSTQIIQPSKNINTFPPSGMRIRRYIIQCYSEEILNKVVHNELIVYHKGEKLNGNFKDCRIFSNSELEIKFENNQYEVDEDMLETSYSVPIIHEEIKTEVVEDIHFKNLDALQYLKSISSDSIDLILTDPPYIISKKTGFKSLGIKSVKRFAINSEFGEWDIINKKEHEILMQNICQEYYRVCKKGATVIIFYDLWKLTNLRNYLESVGFKQFRLIEWIKTNPVPINQQINYLSNAREIAICCVKEGKGTFNSKYDNGIYSFPIPREGRFHPTQKPLKLIKELISKHTNENDIVLDTFCGSGTTLLACKELNRVGMGCEKDIKYYEKALLRVKNDK